MKERYEELTLEIIRFGAADIITTSDAAETTPAKEDTTTTTEQTATKEDTTTAKEDTATKEETTTNDTTTTDDTGTDNDNTDDGDETPWTEGQFVYGLGVDPVTETHQLTPDGEDQGSPRFIDERGVLWHLGEGGKYYTFDEV
ncbi:MAG: hypothetical protein IJ179_06215 [Oscillospiraceae bacterium]|nr:hypothetical protein [Oscillospiraceae bacterium]